MNHYFSRKVLILTTVSATFYWLLESLAHYYIFDHGTFIEALLPHQGEELWMRGFTTILISLFGFILAYFIGEKERHLSNSARFGEIMSKSFNEIYLFDASSLQFLLVNDGALNNLGYSLDEMLCMTPIDIKPGYSRTTFEGVIAPLCTGVSEQITFQTEHCRKDGSVYPVEIRLQLSKTNGNSNFVAIAQDISERIEHEKELKKFALFDALTGLPSNSLLQDRILHAINHAQRNIKPLMIVTIDVRRIEEINAIFGHSNGDKLIQLIATRLQNLFRSADTVSRIGGDKFAVALPGGIDKVSAVSEKILNEFLNPFTVSDSTVSMDIVIGIALYPEHGNTAEALLRHADIALQTAKSNGKRFTIFNVDDNPYSRRKLQLASELRSAILNRDIQLHYQAQVQLKSRKIHGVEALARWIHPTEKMISPGEFIPIAENTGLISELTELAIRDAFSQSKAWSDSGHKLIVSVNLSARNLLDPELFKKIENELKKSGADPKQIALEITESTLMKNPKLSIRTMTELKQFGLELHIDDYGTGFSSLSYLQKFPADCLKIDRSFIINCLEDGATDKIVRSTIELAHDLGMFIIAEGVEDEGTVNYLQEIGCDIVQGFYFSKPQPKESCLVLLN